MPSPDAFLSSPSRAGRQRAYLVVSSSPDLPSLREVLSQKPKRPPLRGGSNAAPIPDDATATFTSAGSLWRSLQSNDAVAQKSNLHVTAPDAEKDVDALVEDSVVELPTGKSPKARKPRPRKNAAPERPEVKTQHPACSNSPAKDQPWKKFKSPTKTTNEEPVEPEPAKATGLVSSHFFKSAEPHKPAKAKATKEEMNEPLHLELATSRRTDWTPPAQKTRIIIDSDPPGPTESHCSQGDGPAEPFETMLASFKCNETLQQEGFTVSDQDSAFLKKRKLIELVPGQAANAPEPSKPIKSPAKQKAPKKKARTITGLATAAYRPPTQTDSDAALGHGNRESEAARPAETAKPKPRKRAPKASKKKPPPPKPILLSPGEALRQVAHQDFVFGTSSQLAREQSPSLLRNLQTDTRDSSRLDHVEFTTPVNSDAIEPPERRQTLWDAGARDADGDLFDVEVCSFADGSPRLPEPDTEADPFGYVRGDGDAIALPDLPAAHGSRDDDSFINLSDIIPAPGREVAEPVDDGSCFSESELSAGTVSRKGIVSTWGGQQDGITPGDGDRDERQASPGPSYELYSDAQLAKQVAQYGFKAIKKRTAMIALLEKCRLERARTCQDQARPASTLAAGASKRAPKAGAAAAAGKEKRPRGRPRKHASVDVMEAQEPPPSAQASDSPKRPRGRPRKDAAASPPRTRTATQVKKDSSRAATSQGPTTPERKGKAKARRRAVEIADSASEDGADLSSPCSSLDETFSPPPAVDLSLSVDEDTELSLVMSPTGQQAALFAHITKAVTTAPRTGDPEHPSWHEKMLLYDPIVLEDLTAWLNSGQLTRVGYDGEASVAEVKSWCESKSICCLWRVNLRGKERKRY